MRFHSGIPALYLRQRPLPGEHLELPEEEERHVRALRLREGDAVTLLDGEGGRTRGVIDAIGRRSIGVRAHETVLEEAEGGTYIALGIGVLSDRSRFEWLVEKGVELGVREIIPLKTERSEGHVHQERAGRIAVAALKQSQRAFLPEISHPLSLEEMLGRVDRFDRAFICHESAPLEDSLSRFLTESPDLRRIALMIGPEGGFTDHEVEAARNASAMVVSLGDARLRAETAAMVALALAASLAGSRPGS